MNLRTIYASSDHAHLHGLRGDYSASHDLPIASFPPEAQAVWSAALAWLAAHKLRPGEVLAGEIVLDWRRDGISIPPPPETPEAAPTSRHLLTASVPVASADGRREIPSTSEEMPPELRDGLLGLIAAKEDSLP
jgi:hypothetical protein